MPSIDLLQLQIRLAGLKNKLSQTTDGKARKSIEEDIGRVNGQIQKKQGIINGYERVVNLAEQNITWGNEMQTHFAELQKTARIDYSIYTEIKDRKVYLVQSQSEADLSQDKQTAEP